jgi:hypothetical protein
MINPTRKPSKIKRADIVLLLDELDRLFWMLKDLLTRVRVYR